MAKSGAATQPKRKETNILETTSDLSRDGVVEVSSNPIACRRVCALGKDEEFPLAHERTPLS